MLQDKIPLIPNPPHVDTVLASLPLPREIERTEVLEAQAKMSQTWSVEQNHVESC